MTPRAALTRCSRAYSAAYEAFALAHAVAGTITNADEVSTLCAAAYRAALPPLSSWENIRAHIACLNQALLLQVISEKEARTLLYSAQTALSTYAREKKTE